MLKAPAKVMPACGASRMLLEFRRIAIAFALLGYASAEAAEPAKVDFSKQVRQILSNNCFACHGPDGAERQAEFRLDMRDSAIGKAESGARPIVPGDAKQSELVKRILSTDPDAMMPPPDSNRKLSD